MKKAKNLREPMPKKWLTMLAVIFALIYSLNCFLISPLRTYMSGDIIYADSAIPTLLDYAHELFELVAIAVSYAVMICVLFRFGKKSIKPVFLLFCLATAYKYTANTAVSWIMYGGIPSLWAWDIVNILYYTLLELVQLMIIYFIIAPSIERHVAKKKTADRAVMRLGENCGISVPQAYPFERIYDRENCLCRSATLCAVVTLIAKLFGNIVSDVGAILMYGLPSRPETWILMAVSYISKLIYAVIAYFVIYAAMNKMLGTSEPK